MNSFNHPGYLPTSVFGYFWQMIHVDILHRQTLEYFLSSLKQIKLDDYEHMVLFIYNQFYLTISIKGIISTSIVLHWSEYLSLETVFNQLQK